MRFNTRKQVKTGEALIRKYGSWSNVRKHSVRTATGLIVVLGLTACNTAPTPPPVIVPAKAPDPRICAAIEPEPSVDGALVQPITPEEQSAFQRFMDAEFGSRLWGRRGWARATLSRDIYCR